MRTPTESELILLKTKRSGLSKNELKKLYDIGGVMTPYTWATLIDNIYDTNIVIYTPNELYDLQVNNKLVVGETYYCEYYGVMNDVISNLSTTMLCYGSAVSNNKFGRFTFVPTEQYPNADKWSFDINFDSLSIENDYEEIRAYYKHCNVNVEYSVYAYDDHEGISIQHNGVLNTSIEMIPIDAEDYGIQWRYVLHMDTQLIPLPILHGNTYFNELVGISADLSGDTLTITYNSSVNDERDFMNINLKITGIETQSFSYYDDTWMYKPDMFITLTNIQDDNMNRMSSDLLTSCYPELIKDFDYYDQEYIRFYSTHYIKCIINSNNCTITDSIVSIVNCNNCVIENSNVRLNNVNNCAFYNSNVIDGCVQYYASGQVPMPIVTPSYMNNCTFTNIRGAYLYQNPNDNLLTITVSKNVNINNIDFENINIDFSYYNCIRPSNSTRLKITDAVWDDTNDPNGHFVAKLN